MKISTSDFLQLSLLLFLGSFITTFVMLPKVRSLASISNFISEPSQRSSHIERIPNIGGLAFFVVIMLFYSFIYQYDKPSIFPNLIPGLTILFIIGLKDDLVMVNPSTKIIAQLTAAFFFVFHNSFSLLNLRGFMWLHDITPTAGIFLTIFLTVALINAFNLLDGIDGFAAIVGIIIFAFYYLFYFLLELYFLAFLNAIISGSIFAFLRFNLSKSKKIFMGDTGSMIIGFMVSVMTIYAISLKNESISYFNFPAQNLPFLLISVLILPLFDTFRVILIRLIQRKHPFHADRQHIHHILLDYLGCSHLKVALILGGINISIITLFYFLLNMVDQTVYFLLIFILISVGFLVLFKLAVKKHNF